MTVYDNLAFGLRNLKVPTREIELRVRRAAAMLDLTPLLKRKPKQLSGGQRQRVALGRAIVREPAAFLMDEPLSNLDAQLRVATRAEILKLQRELRTTTVYVTHDQVEAMTMGDRIAVMRDGVLQQVGPPQELYEHPENMFVAGFIGSPAMNIVPAPLVGAGGEGLVAGFRPEHVLMDGAGDGVSFDGKVEVIEYLGNEKLIHAARNGTTLIALVPVEQAVAEGEKHVFAVPAAKLHLFDAADGRAIRQ
jgi:ABC-type sugar transport system ATPase subunit